CRAYSTPGQRQLYRHVLLSGGERRGCRLGALDRIPEAHGGGFLAPLVPVSLSGGGKRCRRILRHGVSGRFVRWHRGQGQGVVLDHRARDRTYLVPDGGG